jgi:hypothetical protein
VAELNTFENATRDLARTLERLNAKFGGLEQMVDAARRSQTATVAPWPGSILDRAKQQEPADVAKRAIQGRDDVFVAILAELTGIRQDLREDRKDSGRATNQRDPQHQTPQRRRGLLGRLGQAITEPTRKMAGIGRAIGSRIGRRIGKKHSWAKGHNTGKPGAVRGAAIGGAAGAGVAGAVTGVASGLVIAGIALKAFNEAVNRSTDGAIENARRLSEVSGSMAAVLAERDLKETLRGIRRGGATSGSAKELADAEQRRKNAAEPLANAFDNASNKVLATLNDTLTPILNGVNIIVEGLKDAPVIGKAIRKLLDKKEGEEATELDKAMGDLTKQVGKIHERGQKMLDIAREAAREGRAFSAPVGGRV